MQSRMLSRIAKIFFLFSLLLLLNSFQLKPLLASEPIDITQTNLRNDRFTISWVTEVEETGQVNYGETSSLGNTAYDGRGQLTSGKTHHATITGLAANTPYYYEIVSGGGTYNDEGLPYTITTGPVLDPPSGSHVAYGQVFLSSGEPADGAITTLRVEDQDGLGSPGTSQTLSMLVDNAGWWNTELNSLRMQDLSGYFSFSESGDNEIISLRIDKNTPTTITIDTALDHPAPTVTLGWVLNMIEMPWHQNQQPYYTGAATCQMILNYIREGAGVSSLTQDEIYNYAHPISDSQDLTPDEVDKALGHFDPYDVLVSNSYDSYDSLPDGNPYQGYNFSVDTYDSSNPDSLNEYMRDICHWMAFTVTQEEWWNKGDLVARPNTPAAVPIFGDTQGYSHWVAIKGAATSNNPTPEPLQDPWNTPDFTVYGFWIKDSLVPGIGENKYATADECRNTYFKPLNTSDSYNGMYLQVAEPPAKMSTAQVKLATPVSDSRNIELVKLARGELTELQEEPMQIMALSAGVQELPYIRPKKKDLNWENIVDPLLLTDEEAKEAFKDTHPQKPILVHRLDRVDEDYHLIPYNKTKRIEATGYGIRYTGYGRHSRQRRYRSQLTSGVIILDAKKGYFKEASWTKQPTPYSIISRKNAINLVKEGMWEEKEKRYKEILSRFKRRYPKRIYQRILRYVIRYLRRTFRNQFNYRNIETHLVWEAGEYSSSPYKPFWEIVVDGKSWYATQEGKVYKAD